MERTMMTRRIAALVVVLTLTALFAGLAGGCGAKQDSPTASSDPAQAAAASQKMGQQAAANAAARAAAEHH